MKIVIAPDAFKESLSALEVANGIHQGLNLALHPCDFLIIPMADGGAGSISAIMHSIPSKVYKATVTNALFEKTEAHFLLLPDNKTIFIEMAQASGLHLVPKHKRNPLKTTSQGTGELILKALEAGYRNFIIGLGGSATCDAGMGALNALGVHFKDGQNQNLLPMGENLEKIKEIDIKELDPRLKESNFILAYDVTNPLLGLEGALMYVPQKGGSARDVDLLHKGLENFSLQIIQHLEKNIGEVPGGGAAGGLGAGLFAFLNAKFQSGAELIMELLKLDEKISDADLVITGEGQMDSQTLFGKTSFAIAKLAKTKQIPVIAFTAAIQGSLEELYHNGFNSIFSITPRPMPKEESMQAAHALLQQSAYNVGRLLKLKFALEKD